jgi:hypothetical protein
MPRNYAAGANGINMRQWRNACRKATAKDSISPKVHRREGYLATVPMKPDIFTLPRCKSDQLLFPCCGSAAALALANCNEHVSEASISPPHPPTPSLLCTVPEALEVGKES